MENLMNIFKQTNEYNGRRKKTRKHHKRKDPHRKALKNHWITFTNVSDVRSICVNLITEGVISDYEQDDIIVRNRVLKDQICQLAQTVMKKGPKGYEKFIKALEETSQGEIAQVVKENFQKVEATESDEENGKKQYKKKKKRGKVFSIYRASDSEKSSSEEESDSDDKNDIKFLVDYILWIRKLLENLNFDAQTVFKMKRSSQLDMIKNTGFIQGCYKGGAVPKNTFFRQRFV